jgi:hypothetical protein
MKPSFRFHIRHCLAAMGIASGALGCGDPENGGNPATIPECLDPPADATCDAPLYGRTMTGEIAPTFDDVFTKTLNAKCATNSACHSGDTPKNGLSFDDPDAAYDLLMEDSARGNPRLIPGDVACGELLFRLETDIESYGMPPGRPLDEAERCSIRHWIANGAPR